LSLGADAPARTLTDPRRCRQHGIRRQVEVIDADRIDQADDWVVAGDICFRFVIDISTLAKS